MGYRFERLPAEEEEDRQGEPPEGASEMPADPDDSGDPTETPDDSSMTIHGTGELGQAVAQGVNEAWPEVKLI